MSSTSICFFCVRVDGALVAENLRLVWVNPESHFLNCFLEFTQHVPYLFFGCCEQHHVIGKSQVREAVAVMVAQVYTQSFFLLPSLYFVLQRVLKNCVEQQAGHRIPLLRSFLDVDLSASQIDLREMESNAFVKSTVAVHILIHHSWHFCSINLYVARWSVVW